MRDRHQLEKCQFNQTKNAGLSLKHFIIFFLCVAFLTGCVSKGKYEAEKSRALNFQRLLAQEEKRTGELNTQVQEANRQVASLELKNSDLTTAVASLRNEISQQRESLTSTETKSSEIDTSSSKDLSFANESLSDFGLSDLSFDDSDLNDISSSRESTYYTVVRGDTLYRISREYGISVNDIKDLNDLTSNMLSVGQRLIVSKP